MHVTHGFIVLKDDLTHQKTPLMNIMGFGVHINTSLIEIVDCADHCAEGNKKDAMYIDGTMKPHIVKLDPTK